MDQSILSREDRESFVANGFLGPFKVYDQAVAQGAFVKGARYKKSTVPAVEAPP